MQIMLIKKQSYLLQSSDFFAYLLVEILQIFVGIISLPHKLLNGGEGR